MARRRTSRTKGKRNRGRQRYNRGFAELLRLLKQNPDIVREVVFDTARLNAVLDKLLRSTKAGQASVGEDPTKFLLYMAGSADGYPNAQCLEQTKYYCGKGTGINKLYACGGGTGHPNT